MSPRAPNALDQRPFGHQKNYSLACISRRMVRLHRLVARPRSVPGCSGPCCGLCKPTVHPRATASAGHSGFAVDAPWTGRVTASGVNWRVPFIAITVINFSLLPLCNTPACPPSRVKPLWRSMHHRRRALLPHLQYARFQRALAHRATAIVLARQARHERLPCEVPGCFNRRLVVQPAGEIQAFTAARGVQAVGADNLAARLGHMLQVAPEKLFRREVRGAGARPATGRCVPMVPVGKAHTLPGAADLAVAYRAASHIPRQVDGQAPGVVVATFQADVPLLRLAHADAPVPVACVPTGR